MNSILRQETIDLLGLNDLPDEKQEYHLNKATLALTTATMEKAFSLLDENDLDEFEILTSRPDVVNNSNLFIAFFLNRGIDLNQIYKEELIELKIFLRKRGVVLKTSKVKEELFEDFLLDNSSDILTTVGHLSERAAFLMDVGNLALSVIYNPNKNYSSKSAKKKRIKIKIVAWILNALLLFLFDFLLYLVPYFMANRGIITKVPDWISSLVPNFLIELIHKI